MCCYILLDECYTCILFFLDCFYICKDFMESRINYNYNNCTVSKLQWQSMRVADIHINLNLTLTVLQFAFSLHSVSVSYLCYILSYKHHYACSHCAQLKPNQWNTNCKWLQITPPTHRGKLNDTMETVACGATSGVFLRYCSWNGSVTVLPANRWQSKVLAAGIFSHTDGITQCVTSCPTHHSGSRHIPELRHRIRLDELAT